MRFTLPPPGRAIFAGLEVGAYYEQGVRRAGVGVVSSDAVVEQSKSFLNVSETRMLGA